MPAHTVRDTTLALPGIDEPGRQLSDVTSLTADRTRVMEFRYRDASLRELDLSGSHLVDGHVARVTAQRVRLEDVRVDSVEFTGCTFSLLECSDSKLTRVAFKECKLLGATLRGVVLDNVLFEKCKLDYSSFVHIRASGPVIFSGCSLAETTFTGADLGPALFDGCVLTLTEFDGGRLHGLDLRGNDLSRIRGVGSLRRVVVDRPQLLQLAEALAVELDVTYGDDPGNE
jgi:uncharacterized protein YjbI with pentapeptide repeats